MKNVISTKIEPIKAYGLGHLILCLIVVLLVVLLILLLKKADKTKVLFSTGIVLLILEVLKQFLLVKIYGAYSWSDFPFQLCSIPMYLCLLYPVIKKGRRTLELFLRSFGILGAISAFAVPYDVFSNYLLLSLHSIIWHTLLLFLGIYCVTAAENRSRINLRSIRELVLFYLGLAVIAVCINALLYNISGGTANMFFLGPAKPCVNIFDNIYDKHGWIAESVTVICGSEFFGILFLLLGELFWKKGYYGRNQNQ